MDHPTLYWNTKGEIACTDHVPAAGSERWGAERWSAMPDLGARAVRYQCQHCVETPLRSIPRQPRTPLILNVDDRPAARYARDRGLRLHGFSVANAATGHATLDLARRINPHLVLLDVHLTDMDGREVCRQLKTDEATASIPVVLISSTLGVRGERPNLAEIHADFYVPEPVTPADLAATLRRVLAVAGRDVQGA
jgi:CheY-like chemotaxis protein